MTEIENINEARDVAQAAEPARLITAGPSSPANPPRQNPLTAPFLLLIKLYQWTLSPLLHALAGPNAGCRYYPTCSCYAAEALRAHGLFHGTALAAWRLLRCNPFTPGGVDLVPPARPPAPARPRCERVA